MLVVDLSGEKHAPLRFVRPARYISMLALIIILVNSKWSKKMKRRKPNQKRAHRKFTATALKTNSKNVVPANIRGGYRI